MLLHLHECKCPIRVRNALFHSSAVNLVRRDTGSTAQRRPQRPASTRDSRPDSFQSQGQQLEYDARSPIRQYPRPWTGRDQSRQGKWDNEMGSSHAPGRGSYSRTYGGESSRQRWSSPPFRQRSDEEWDEDLHRDPIPTLKNRNAPMIIPSDAAAPRPSHPRRTTSRREPDEPPAFYNPPEYLSHAGVPIIVKADSKTGSKSYSDAMSEKHDVPRRFTSPPLLPGLHQCLNDVLGGGNLPPTPIQALSLKWVLQPWTPPLESSDSLVPATDSTAHEYSEYLLASETGSGKTFAYLLPLLQSLKLSEPVYSARMSSLKTVPSGPRALVLAPTHELARQLSSAAKSLVHDIKLRVKCVSRANIDGASIAKTNSASRMKAELLAASAQADSQFSVLKKELSKSAPADVLVGTPMKIMEMVFGRGWDREVQLGGGASESDTKPGERGPRLRRGRDNVPGFGQWKSRPELDLSQIEWVVVDEADVLFDSDFQETTRMLLAEISKARGQEVAFTPLPIDLLATSKAVPHASKALATKAKSPAANPLNYPFNFLLTSATIPAGLSTYLSTYHPRMQRLISPNLHMLPKSLQIEHVPWTGGNKLSDIERRLRQVWADDAGQGRGPAPGSTGDMSKVLVFCNRNTKVEALGTFLEEKGIKTITLSSSSENRSRGSNKHLLGFLKPEAQKRAVPADETELETKAIAKVTPVLNDPMNVPHVMITTSLLSRGLDFSPLIEHVFIVESPRNMIDFLHRAGRTGRAGSRGTVVVFGKSKGRGSQQTRDLKTRLRAIRA
ncbi:unnamed protein product [Mycena citricolor]|uniref:RNA helicase n=1 Tax=Mycena citricolor TaxID=2018698 RepID=A0AAD2HDS5_9AGAR|nr:unnamed protein product [Mycena citricolor]